MSETAALRRVRPFPFAELPRLTRAQVEAGRVLLRHLPLEAGAEWAEACRVLGGPVELELVEAYALPAQGLAAELRGTVVKLIAAAGRFALVVLDPRLAPALARRALGTDTEPELAAPRPLTLAEGGAIEFLLAALVDGYPLRIEGVLSEAEVAQLLAGLPSEASGPADGWIYGLHARLSTPVGAGWARLFAPEALRLAFQPARAGALYDRRERLSDARVSLRLEAGRTALARGDLAALAPHDVVLFDRIGVRDARGGPVVLRLGRGGFRARLDGEALTVAEPYRLNLGAPPMSQDDQETDRPAGADPLLSELPVEVVCELGRVTMTGKELLELRPGAVIPVGRSLAGPVDLTVGGRVVARGELVDVEGEIGVRVTQITD